MNKKELWEYFFNKPKKHYNKYMFEFPNYEEYLLYDDEYILTLKSKWCEKLFKNNKKLFVEIGSGSANFTYNMAKRFPENNYLGLEIRLKRLIQAARKVKKCKLENIKFVKKRVQSLKELFSKNEIDGLFINFPDPWENEEHKRIFSKNLLNDLDEILKINSYIYFKTDHMQYYLDILELIENNNNYEIIYKTDDLYNSDKSKDNIKTEFEHLFTSKLKVNIKYIEIKKIK